MTFRRCLPLFFVVFGVVVTRRDPSDSEPFAVIRGQFAAIRDVIRSGGDPVQTLSIHTMPELLENWRHEAFDVANYRIDSAFFTDSHHVGGHVAFRSPDGKSTVECHVDVSRLSIDKWTTSFEDCRRKTAVLPLRFKRQYADPDCEWWGCIDG